jgi:hypothetical protein
MPSKRVIDDVPILSRRALNRALLERQLLLRRVSMPTEAAIRHLVAIQAQNPFDPYFGLWTRLEGFDPHELAGMLLERRVVRATSMHRTTIHLMTADDWLALRPVLQVVSERGFSTGSPFGRNLKGLDIDEVIDAGLTLLEEQPRTATELRAQLAKRWPDRDPGSLAYAVRYLVPLVQIPPRAIWGRSGQPVLATAETWLGRSVGTDTDPSDMILRYLRAFGPASVMDIQAWCWLTRLKPFVERLRPILRTFRDENGVELFDVPDGPLPDADTVAPPRFLPVYDNIVLSHKDRSRVTGDRPSWLVTDPQVDEVFGGGSVLVDGFVSAGWRIERKGKKAPATLKILPVRALSAAERVAVEDEGRSLLSFAADDAGSRAVRFVEPSGSPEAHHAGADVPRV